MSKSKGIADVGVRTRARTLAMAAAKKKRKVDSVEPELTYSCRRRRRLLVTPKSETSKSSGKKLRISTPSSDFIPVPRCSSNDSSELANEKLVGSVVDLENQSSTRREATASSSLREESDDLELTKKEITCRSTEERTSPSEAEMEEFFLTAEREDQRRFVEKYNYDIAKDIPLKGRYEWVSLNSEAVKKKKKMTD